MATVLRRVIVVGGNGALGRAVAARFASEKDWSVASVDFAESSVPGVHSIVLQDSSVSSSRDARHELQKADFGSVDAVVHAAGSWAGSSVDSDEFADSLEHLWSANVRSAALAANLAGNFLSGGGLFTLTGAVAALDQKGTPGMAAYGLTKAATHHLLASVSQNDGSGGLPADAYANAILPNTIDTEANRSAMPDADLSSWTPPEHIASELFQWASTPSLRPADSGCLVEVHTENFSSSFRVVE